MVWKSRVNLSNLNEICLETIYDLKWVEIKACNANTLTTHRILPLPIVTNVTSCKNLKFITVYQLSMKKEWFSSEISNFPLLEYLQITECCGGGSVRIASPSLKTLILKCWMELIEAKIETPNLQYVWISGWSGIINFECFFFVRSNSLFAPMLWSQHSMVCWIYWTACYVSEVFEAFEFTMSYSGA